MEIEISGKHYTGPFLVADKLGEDLILGRNWLVQHRVVHDHFNNCLFIGRHQRQQVFTTPGISQRNEEASENFQETLTHHFTDAAAETFQKLVKRHGTIFHKGGHLRQALTSCHEIHLKTAQPFREAQRNFSEVKKKAIEEQIPEMLAERIIEPASSPYSSQPSIQTKKDGTQRFCIDYRRLNDLTIDAAQPLPVIHQTLKDLGQAKIFSTIDLKSGYWQIPLHPNSRKYTAFATPDGGQYQFRVMPFGLKNAPCTFQNTMKEILGTFWRKFVIAYLDDLIVYSYTEEEHLNHLALIFERLEIYGLSCNPKKCHFGKTKLEYLGHIVTSDGNQAQPEHIQAILEANPPRTRKELRSFHGTCGWLREYIPHFAITAAPLTDLLAVSRPFKWTAAAQESFEKIKALIKKPLALSRPNPQLPFILQTDASAKGMGAVLFQENKEKKKLIISYASAKFSPTESRYHCNEQECLAVIWGIKRYRPYLEDNHFTLRTDSTALTWLRKMKDEKSKLARWSCLLGEFSFTIEHCAGKYNELADALSRYPAPDAPTPGEPDLDRMMIPIREKQATTGEVRPAFNALEQRPLIDEIGTAQQRDPVITREIERWQQLTTLPDRSDQEEKFVQEHRLDERGFWKKHPNLNSWSLRVPVSHVDRILWEYHDDPFAGHPGCDETLREIQSRYYWPGMRRRVRKYVSSCHLCTCCKPVRTAANDSMRPRAAQRPWETIALDLMGPYPPSSTGKKFLLVVTDLFSRWIEAFPMASAEAPKLTALLEKEVFPRWGYPRQILTDNGRQFVSQHWASAGQRWDCDLWTTPNYHPRANPTERRNQDIKINIRLRIDNGNHRTWDRDLPKNLFSLRRRQNAATGQTPSHLLLGWTLPRPGDWRFHEHDDQRIEERNDREERAKANQGKYQQRYTGETPMPRFEPGEQVYVVRNFL